MPLRRGLALLTPLLLAGTSGCFFTFDDDDGPPADTSKVIVRDACPGDPSVVDEVRVEGDELVVSASYGGCGTTRIWACWDGSFLESFPVQAPIRIHHEPAGLCDAWLTQTARFDLDPVIDAYADGYGRLDPIVLSLDRASVTWEP